MSLTSKVNFKKIDPKSFFLGPVPPFLYAPGEYFASLLDGNAVGYNIVGKPSTISGWPSGIIAMASGTHGQIVTNGTKATILGDNNLSGQAGNGTTGSGAFGPIDVTTDSLGNTFSNITLVGSGGTIVGQTNWLVEHGPITDTLFATGATDGGLHVPGPSSGINTKFVKIFWVTGEHIKKVQMDVFAFVLTTSGKLYDWGGSNSGFAPQYCLAQGTSTPVTDVPTQIIFPGHTVIDVAGGSFWNDVILDDGTIRSSAFYVGYTGVGGINQVYNQPNAINTWWNADTALGLPAHAVQIAVNGTCTYALLTNGQIWAWGDNSMGGIGDGTELDWANYTVSPSPTGGTPAPWNWDQGLGERMGVYRKPHQVCPGKNNFIAIFTSNALCFYVVAEDANGNMYGWGRNKGGVQGDGSVGAGVSGGIAATYPTSWDNVYPKLLTSYPTTTFSVTSPFCILNPSGSPCNNYSIPTHTAPTNVFSVTYKNGMLITNLSLSTDLSGVIYHYWHRQTGGQPLQMGAQDQPIDTILNAIPGHTYSFRGTVVNPTFDSTAVILSFTVPKSNQIGPIPFGGRIILH